MTTFTFEKQDRLYAGKFGREPTKTNMRQLAVETQHAVDKGRT